MSAIGDCLAKLGVDPQTEQQVISRVKELMDKNLMTHEGASVRVLRDMMHAIDGELKDIGDQIIKAGGSQEHVNLLIHIARHGEIEIPKTEGVATQLPGTEKSKGAYTPEGTARPVEPGKLPESEHVAGREKNIGDDAKQIVVGAPHADKIIESYTRGVEGVEMDVTRNGQAVKIKVGERIARAGEMQGLIDALLDTKVKTPEELRRANEAIDKLNEAIGEQVKSLAPADSYAMKLKSLEGIDATKEASVKTREEIESHLRDVLGPKVTVEWRNLGHAGEFDNLDIIRLSVHSLNPKSTAYHESLHAFFSKLSEMKQFGAMKTLVRAANSAPVLNQLRKLYKDNPEVLKQIDSDPEERVAYMYQNWADKKITIGPESKSTFQKIKDFFLRVMGIWTNDQRAEHIMEYFNSGEFAKNMDNTKKIDAEFNLRGTNEVVDVLKGVMKPVLDMGAHLVTAGSERMRDTNNASLIRIADLILPEKTRETGDVGYLQSSHNEYTTRMNKLAKSLEGATEEQLTAAFDAIKNETVPTDVAAKRIQDTVYGELRSTLNYLKAAGVKVGDLGPKYFPRVWDVDKITKNKDAFVEMLSKAGIKQPEKVAAELIARGGAEESILIDRPGNAHEKQRVLREVSNADAADFVKDNLFDTLNNYMMQATRRAEFARRFNGASDMRTLLREAKEKYGATDKEVQTAKDFVHGVLGTLGDDMNPTVRRFMGNMIVYQNLRLLPFAIFSQVIDPLGIAVRGGTVGDAANAFMRGIKEIPRGFKKNKSKDEAYEMAETLGVIENAALANSMSSVYTQGMAGSFARKVNDALFKYNLVEQFNTSMRVAGTEAALRFFARHANGDYSRHSQRFLGELGFKPGEIIVKDGRPLITRAEFLSHGMTLEQANAAAIKMRGAVNRWVDGAVLRPNAAERTIWMNDPHFALFAHLKTFIYAFQHTILDRVIHEIKHDNAAPALALMSYVPVMFASDMAKGYIMGMGEQPEWKKGWGWHQYLNSAVERAGLYGTGQFATDLVRDVHRQNIAFAALGPTYEQVVDSLKTLGGKEQFSTFAIHGMPANAIYSGLLGKGAPDPKFVE